MSLKSLVLSVTPEFLLWRMKARRYSRLLADLPLEEEPSFHILPALLREGDIAVDAGANFGIYTRFLSGLVGERGEVHSFEPVPHTYRVLRTCVSRLGMTNVKTWPFALSDRTGGATMRSPSYKKGGSNYYKSFIAEGRKQFDPGRECKVRLRKMDQILESLTRPVRFIKIDVEGHELPLIEGARETIDRWRPALLIEVSRNPDDPESTSSELFRILAGDGYSPFYLSGKALCERKPGTRSVDYFFLNEHHLAAIDAAGIEIRAI